VKVVLYLDDTSGEKLRVTCFMKHALKGISNYNKNKSPLPANYSTSK
jgi:hypothetical protein